MALSRAERRSQVSSDSAGISDEDYRRRLAKASQAEFAVVRTSRGRWAVRKKRFHVGGFLAKRSPDGDHGYVIDWLAFEPIPEEEGCENLTYGAAMAKLHDLMYPDEEA